jgi:hypothetical protein
VGSTRPDSEQRDWRDLLVRIVVIAIVAGLFAVVVYIFINIASGLPAAFH